MGSLDPDAVAAVARAPRGVTFMERMGSIGDALVAAMPGVSFGASVVSDVDATPAPELAYSTARTAADIRDYFANYARANPLTPALRRGDGALQQLSAALPARERARNAYASEYLARHGVGDVLMVSRRLPTGEMLLFGIAVPTPRRITGRVRRSFDAASADIGRAAHDPALRARLLASVAPGTGEVHLDARGDVVRVDLAVHAVFRDRGTRDPFAILQAHARMLVARRVPTGWTQELVLPLRGDRAARARIVKLDPRSGLGAVALVDPPSSASPSFESARLTPRETEVAALVVTGTSNAEISKTLGLSVDAVKWHLKKIFRKTGVASRSELTALRFGGIG